MAENEEKTGEKLARAQARLAEMAKQREADEQAMARHRAAMEAELAAARAEIASLRGAGSALPGEKRAYIPVLHVGTSKNIPAQGDVGTQTEVNGIQRVYGTKHGSLTEGPKARKPRTTK